jgi:hypothetical protein
VNNWDSYLPLIQLIKNTHSCALHVTRDQTQPLDEWLKNFWTHFPTSHAKHWDVLFLGTEEGVKVADLEQLNHFTLFQAQALAKKLCFITASGKLSHLVYNKLLKILEESPIELAIIFVDHPWRHLPKTIQSRLIQFRQRVPSTHKLMYSESLNKCVSFEDFLGLIQREQMTEVELVHQLQQQMMQTSIKVQYWEKWLQLLQWMESSSTMNQPFQERGYFLFQFLLAIRKEHERPNRT